MTSASSPYAVFRAGDFGLPSYSPIGIGQCLRISPKKYYTKKDIQTAKNGSISKKGSIKDHVQLKFA